MSHITLVCDLSITEAYSAIPAHVHHGQSVRAQLDLLVSRKTDVAAAGLALLWVECCLGGSRAGTC